MNFLVFLPIISLMMFVHELGHFVTARMFGITVQEFGFGLPPRLIGIRRNGVIYSLNLIPFGAFVKMLGEEDPTAPGSFAGKPRLVRAIVLAAGSFMNFLLAIVAFTLMFQVGVPYIDPNGPASFSSVMVDSPAAQAGIQAGDQVVSFNGQAVTVDQFRRLTRENEGQTVQLVIDREGAQVPITVTPHRDADSQAVVIGVILASNGSPNPLESLVDGTKFAASQVVGTFLIPKQIIEGSIRASDARPVGLVGMAQMTGDAADTVATTGMLYPLFALTGAFSAGLAVANMLPIPALDGGRLFFVIIEAIRGRRISPEREAAFHFAGLLLLLTLMVLISANDIVSPLPKINWGLR